jgi:hypothetical protein
VTEVGPEGQRDQQTGFPLPRSGAADRDIDLLLLTGAGASCGFGTQGRPLPLMGDWAKDIYGHLLKDAPGCVVVTGLTDDMSGPDFERQLGTFLRQRDALRMFEPLIKPSLQLPGVPPDAAMTGGGVVGWYSAATTQFDRVLGVIAESLYRLFATPTADLQAASGAYGRLLDALELAPRQSRLVLATTNYDTIGERALADNGWLPDWGEMPPQLFGSAVVPIQVEGILDGMPRYVPVLHLHGCVGWYRKDDQVLPTRANRHDSTYGTPVVVYPDPEKDYGGDLVIAGLWGQFCLALDRAKRVLILGHSLNDRAVLQEVLRRVRPHSRIAVSILADAGNRTEFDSSATDLMERVRTELSQARIFPLRFGPDFEPDRTSFRSWLSDTEAATL